MNKIVRIGKHIEISKPMPEVVYFVVMIDEDTETGLSHKLIKWSVRNGESDNYFVIDSINPLRVFGGIAAISDRLMHSMVFETEQEVIEFAKSIDAAKMEQLIKDSYFIGYRDQLELMKPPGVDIVLYKPTEEELKQREKLLAIFYGSLADL